MNRSIWTQDISEYQCPKWPCVGCKTGFITIDPKSIAYKETAESKEAHAHDDWAPDWISSIFTVWAKCSSCKHEYVISGRGGIEPTMTSEGETDWDYYFHPQLCLPMPDICALPIKCPDEIKKELRSSFALFWINQASCAGRVRVALERLMDHVGIPKWKRLGGGKSRGLTLHDRINAFAATNPTVGEQLMAIKWLGNTGSHSDVITKDDLLDGFEILEDALIEIIEGRSERIRKLTKQVLRKHKK